ncbi:MAG: HEAT repeat domain-containing protein [Methyloligellaceae bacterium]
MLGSGRGFAILKSALGSKNELTRRDVVRALGKIGGSRIIPLLRDALFDGNNLVRMYAAEAMANTGGDTRAVAILLSTMDLNSDKSVQREAAYSLARLGNDKGVAKLKSMLSERKWSTREAAAYSLLKLNHPAGIEYFMKVIKGDHDKSRGFAAFAFGKVSYSKALPEIIAALDDPSPLVRKEAAKGLKDFKDPEAQAAFRKYCETGENKFFSPCF